MPKIQVITSIRQRRTARMSTGQRPRRVLGSVSESTNTRTPTEASSEELYSIASPTYSDLSDTRQSVFEASEYTAPSPCYSSDWYIPSDVQEMLDSPAESPGSSSSSSESVQILSEPERSRSPCSSISGLSSESDSTQDSIPPYPRGLYMGTIEVSLKNRFFYGFVDKHERQHNGLREYNHICRYYEHESLKEISSGWQVSEDMATMCLF